MRRTRAIVLSRCALSVVVVLCACAPGDASGPSAPQRTPQSTLAAVKEPKEPKGAKDGGITIALDVQPNRPVDVSFATAGKKLKDFALDDDATSKLPGAITFSKLKPGTYTVQQAAVSGIAVRQIQCTSSANGGPGLDNNTVNVSTGAVTIQLEQDETVACTFVDVDPVWATGDLFTGSQFRYDTDLSMLNAYDDIYSSTFGVVEVGIPGAAGFSIRVSSANNVRDYFVASGPVGPLTSDMNDPTSTSSGTFGGEALALRLNIDFSAAGAFGTSSGLTLGALTLCNMSDASLDGLTVDDIMNLANTVLGGGTSAYTPSEIGGLAVNINLSFDAGTPSDWAQAHLVPGPCP